MKARGRPPKPTQGRGPIDGNAVYPLGIFLRRLGISRSSLTSARRRGLPVHFPFGRRAAVVFGWEAVAWLRSNPEQGTRDALAAPGNSGDSAGTVLPTVPRGAVP